MNTSGSTNTVDLSPEAIMADVHKRSLVMRICTAYESGMGRGMSKRDLAQPYEPTCEEGIAYATGWYHGRARIPDEPAGVVDEGKLWSFLSSVLRQGMAIQQDIADYPTSEHLSAHMDEAARKRTDEFMQRCATAPPPPAVRTECPYCHAPTDGSGGILHTYPCAGLQEVRISRLRLDWLRAHPESVAYEFSETKAENDGA